MSSSKTRPGRGASRAAAKPRPTAVQSGDQYLTFALGDEVFGMDIRTVREIIQLRPMATVPLMPDFVRGVINLRGAVVPVIDLSARFGRGQAAEGQRTCIVIFDSGQGGERVELGLMVDAVSEVIAIGADQIEPPPEFGASIRREFIRGMGKVGERFVVLLEPDRAVDLEEMANLCAGGTLAAA
jgi:purine-binding chemotaxis protein CheW